MSHLLEILGRGLLSELAAAFRELLADPKGVATEELEQAARFSDGDAQDQLTLGVRLLHEHRFDRARLLFERILAQDENDYTARVGLACALDATQATADAARELGQALRCRQSDAPLWFALGFCHEKLGETDEAVRAYERTLDLTPQLRNAHERLAAIYLQRDEPEPALAHYEHLCWCEPCDLHALLTLASLYLRVGRYDDAIRRFEHAICLDPDNWEVQDDLVAVYERAGRIEQAIELLQNMIQARPDCAEHHVRLGDLLAESGNDALALEAYETAATLNPGCLEATVKLGTMHLTRGAYADAARTFSRAIEINDRLVDCYIGLGVAQNAAGATSEALASFDTASRIEPNGTLLFSEMAKLQLRVSAADHQRRQLTLRDDRTTPMASTDTLDELVGDQIGNLERAIAERPTHADLHYRLGVLRRHIGDVDGAIRAFSEAVAINPQYAKALIKLGLTLRDAGDQKAAICAFDRALDLDQESIDLHYQLGLMFADEAEFAAALDHFEFVTRHEPNNRDYLANLALALQNMGLLDRATATWQVLCDLTPTDDLPSSLRADTGSDS